MKPRLRNGLVVAAFIVLGAVGPLGAQLTAQPAELKRHTEVYAWTTGMHDGSGERPTGTADAARMVLYDVVTVPGSPWIQLTFANTNLGARSYLEITSLDDGAT